MTNEFRGLGFMEEKLRKSRLFTTHEAHSPQLTHGMHTIAGNYVDLADKGKTATLDDRTTSLIGKVLSFSVSLASAMS